MEWEGAAMSEPTKPPVLYVQLIGRFKRIVNIDGYLYQSYSHWGMFCIARSGLEEMDDKQLIMHIQAALNTEETGAALIEVARNAHRAELELAAILIRQSLSNKAEA